ncbi:Sucrose symporter plant, partial [Penicillium herquei]
RFLFLSFLWNDLNIQRLRSFINSSSHIISDFVVRLRDMAEATRKQLYMEEAIAYHDDEDSHNFYPVGPKLILITISLMLAVFCVALDNTRSLPIMISQLHRLEN